MEEMCMQRKKRTGAVLQTILAILVTAVMIFPIYWMLNTALKPSSELLTKIPHFWPSSVELSNFTDAMTKVPLGRYLWNTLVVTFFTTVSQVVTGVLAAYAFSKGNFAGKNLLCYLVLGAMMIPEQVTFIPLYVLCSRMHWINTYMGLMLPKLVSPYFIFMVRQAFMTVDQSYIDAGRIDGLGIFGTIRYVMMPMCKATIITVTLLSVIGSWNSYFWPKIVTNKDEYRMISVGLVKLYDSFGDGEILEKMNVVMAGALISMVPIVLLFLVFQKYMLTGYSKAAMK
jgi:ABC-type glycerol-3-phosphate transport system permease component